MHQKILLKKLLPKKLISSYSEVLILFLSFFIFFNYNSYATNDLIKTIDAHYIIESQIHEQMKYLLSDFDITFTNHTLEALKKLQIQGTESSSDGREKELEEIENSLVKMKEKIAVLIGDSGVGKKYLTRLLAEKIILKNTPHAKSFEKIFNNALVIQVSASSLKKISGEFFRAIISAEYQLQRPIIVVIDKIHELDSLQSLHHYLESSKLKVIGTASSNEFQMAFKLKPELLRLLQPIAVEELGPAITQKIIQTEWKNKIENEYLVNISNEAITEAIRLAPTLVPDSPRPDGPIKLLEKLAIQKHRESLTSSFLSSSILSSETVIASDVLKMYANITGLPADPSNLLLMSEYEMNLKKNMKESIIGQNLLVNQLVDSWISLISSNSQKPKVVMITGPTGTGKTLAANELVRLGAKRPQAILEINGSEFAGGNNNPETVLFKLFGAPNGFLSSDKSSGLLPEWLDDPSKGKFGGIIIFNEAEKMSPAVWKYLMEFFDGKGLTGGDGKKRNSTKHLVILTSNQGASEIFPPSTVKMWSQNEIDNRVLSFNQASLKNLFIKPSQSGKQTSLPPEVINRIDYFIVSSLVSKEAAIKIGAIASKNLTQELENKYKVQVNVSASLNEYLSLAGYSISDGARQISRQVENYIRSSTMKGLTSSLPEIKSIDLDIGHNSQHEPFLSIYLTSNSHSTLNLEATLPENNTIKPPTTTTIFKLKKLKTSFKKNVIGQDDIADSLNQSLIAAMANGSRTRPLSLFLIGTTGTGKTETGKAIAEALYDSAERASVIDLSKIKHSSQLSEIFGSKHDVDKISPFEQTLKNNPQGGVIIFDEATNMGGDNISEKESSFKSFYSMIEEGKWTSPATGDTYELSKFFFLFTGNDGEKLLQSASSDDLRMSIWNKVKSRGNITSYLVKIGVPEAFLGRQADILFSKPLLKSEVDEITLKFLNQTKNNFQKQYGFEIIYDKKFAHSLSENFYTHNSGARSIRNFMENRMEALIIQALMDHDLLSRNDGVKIKLGLVGQWPKQPFVEKTYTPKFNLKVSVYNKSELVASATQDITNLVPQRKLLSLDEAKATAYHEAGHALVNQEHLSGMLVDFITIVPSGEAIGYVRYDDNKILTINHEMLVNYLASLWAGSLSQQKAGYPLDSGWTSDRNKLIELAEKAILQWGFAPEFMQTKKEDMSPRERKKFDSLKDDLIEEGRVQAELLLNTQWNKIELLVQNLLENGTLNRTEFLEISRSTNLGNKSQKGTDQKASRTKSQNKILRCEAIFL